MALPSDNLRGPEAYTIDPADAALARGRARTAGDPNPMAAPALTTTALALRDAGYAPLPIRPDGSKAPAVPWTTYRDTPPDRDLVARWFTSLDTDGLGVVCGPASGMLEMLEAEGRAIPLLPELATLLADHGLTDLWHTLNTGWVELTPGGGMHWHYRVSDGPARPNTKLARRPGPTGPEVLLETRGAGGFTVLAPSAGRSHPTAAAWTRLAGGPDTCPLITSEQRDALYAVASLLDRMPTADPAPPRPATPTTPSSGLRPGDDYTARTNWEDILTPRGWTRGRKLGTGWTWARPGKHPRDGISATTGTRGDGVDRLYVFSTSTEFEAERPYSKFAALALLEYGGDYTAAAKALTAAGYGTPAERVDPLAALILPPTPPASPTATVGSDEETSVPMGPSGPVEPQEPPQPATWATTDLTAYLDGTHTPTIPTLMPRTDGVHLLYPGLTHSLHGESESGKSMLAQIETARLIAAGKPVLYIDFESDAAAIVERLLTLGASRDAIATHLDYRRPELNPTAITEVAAWQDMLARRYALAVVDGVTDSLGVFGLSTKDNDEITRWMRALPRQVAAKTGAAVVVIDHVTKDADTRGRFAIGGQAKLAGLSGAAYSIEIAKPLGRGLRGEIVMRVAKDRPGYVRGRCAPMRSDRTQEAARVVVDSTGPTILTTVTPGASATINASEPRPRMRFTGIMQNVSEILESDNSGLSLRTIRNLVTANNDRLAIALADLHKDGFITITEGPRGAAIHRSVRPYRQRQDPLSDLFDPLLSTGQNRQSRPCPTVPDRAPGHGEVTVPTVPLPFRGTVHGHDHSGTTDRAPIHPPPSSTPPRPYLVNLTTGEVRDHDEDPE